MEQSTGENIVFETAAAFINNSNQPVFLTGKAGTGKTTFLRYIREKTSKNTVVVAPTGVAAINAGGTTIHSFFQLPFGPYIPAGRGDSNQGTDKQSLLSKLRLNSERKELMQQLELLIIDEISMVRCDVLDAIDAVLRYVRGIQRPFGGVQVLYIGDMYQLPPVVRNEEASILYSFYQSPFFFSSQVCQLHPPVYLELEKVYRQTDQAFIDLLNQVRNNQLSDEGYELLHSRYQPGHFPAEADNGITLTTHNQKADVINEAALAELRSPVRSFKAIVEGEFNEKAFPAEEILHLKLGAKVMFIKNDTEKIRRYFNGKIGTIEKIEEDNIWVRCDGNEQEQLIELKKETWRNIQYSLNKKSQQVEEEELGSFMQFPLRLAWAITIHKSQGLTFEKAEIDAGSAFSPGQVYVALSRCTSLEGMILKTKIGRNNLRSDERVVAFSQTQASSDIQQKMLANATRLYQQDLMKDIVDFSELGSQVAALQELVQAHSYGLGAADWIRQVKLHVDVYEKYGTKFQSVLNTFFLDEMLPEENTALQQRFSKAAAWFIDELAGTKKLLAETPAVSDNRQAAVDFNQKIEQLWAQVLKKIWLFQLSTNGFNLNRFQAEKNKSTKEAFPVNIYSGSRGYIPATVVNPSLYVSLRDKRDELCKSQDLPLFMVCSTESLEQMSRFLPTKLADLGKIKGFGKIKLKQFGENFLSIIRDFCSLEGLSTNMEAFPDKKSVKTTRTALKPDSKLISFDMFKQGKTIAEIAAERNLTVATIETHFVPYLENGSMNLEKLMPAEKFNYIKSIFNTKKGFTFTQIREEHPELSFGELRWVSAHEQYLASRQN